MSKISKLVPLLILLSACANKGVEPLLYDKGKYSNSPFEYPSTLRASEVAYIVKEINAASEHNISKVSLGSDYRYDVTVCSTIDRSNERLSYCRNAKRYRFGYGRNGFANFQITPHEWHDFPLYQFRFNTDKNVSEYALGKYRDIPIYYPNSISESEFSVLVSSVEAVSENEIMSIRVKSENQLEITTCKSGSRLPNHCGTGGMILYDQEQQKIIKRHCCWVQ